MLIFNLITSQKIFYYPVQLNACHLSFYGSSSPVNNERREAIRSNFLSLEFIIHDHI
jgi:hypothetical protein